MPKRRTSRSDSSYRGRPGSPVAANTDHRQVRATLFDQLTAELVSQFRAIRQVVLAGPDLHDDYA